jgi:hypothetical protein
VVDAATGEALGPPLRHGSTVEQAAFSPDGRRAVTRCAGQVVRSWDLTAEDLPPLSTLLLLARELAGSEIDGRRGPVPLSAERLQATWRKLQAATSGNE